MENRHTLVTPREARHASVKAQTVSDTHRLYEFYLQLTQLAQEDMKEPAPFWCTVTALCALYYAGLIDGVRRERAKRRSEV